MGVEEASACINPLLHRTRAFYVFNCPFFVSRFPWVYTVSCPMYAGRRVRVDLHPWSSLSVARSCIALRSSKLAALAVIILKKTLDQNQGKKFTTTTTGPYRTCPGTSERGVRRIRYRLVADYWEEHPAEKSFNRMSWTPIREDQAEKPWAKQIEFRAIMPLVLLHGFCLVIVPRGCSCG